MLSERESAAAAAAAERAASPDRLLVLGNSAAVAERTASADSLLVLGEIEGDATGRGDRVFEALERVRDGAEAAGCGSVGGDNSTECEDVAAWVWLADGAGVTDRGLEAVLLLTEGLLAVGLVISGLLLPAWSATA